VKRAPRNTIVTEVPRADYASYQRLYRQRRPEVYEYEKAAGRARQRAHSRLGREFPEEFERLFAQELRKEGYE